MVPKYLQRMRMTAPGDACDLNIRKLSSFHVLLQVSF